MARDTVHTYINLVNGYKMKGKLKKSSIYIFLII